MQLIVHRGFMLVAGCVLLGLGVAMLLAANLGSDGYSTFINGLAISLAAPFWLVNAIVAVVLLAVAALRGVRPGVGTLVQVAIVGPTVSIMLPLLQELGSGGLRLPMLVLAFPVLAIGVASYLGAQLGAGPAEAAALAWDPPFPFQWSYNAVQASGALIGWALGATIGLATVAVVVLLGPCINLASRLLRLDVHQGRRAVGVGEAAKDARSTGT